MKFSSPVCQSKLSKERMSLSGNAFNCSESEVSVVVAPKVKMEIEIPPECAGSHIDKSGFTARDIIELMGMDVYVQDPRAEDGRAFVVVNGTVDQVQLPFPDCVSPSVSLF